MIDITWYEVSGFMVTGNYWEIRVPDNLSWSFPICSLMLLSGVALSGTSWASFVGDIKTTNDLYANNAFITNDVTISGDLVVSGSAFFDTVEINSLDVYNLSAASLTASYADIRSGDAYFNNLSAEFLSASYISAVDILVENLTAVDVIVDNDVTVLGDLVVSGNTLLSSLMVSGDTFFNNITAYGETYFENLSAGTMNLAGLEFHGTLTTSGTLTSTGEFLRVTIASVSGDRYIPLYNLAP